jgi:hypothetical protein
LFRQVGFSTKSTLRVGEIISDDEIPCGDEIRLDAGWVDLISSEAKPKISSLRQQGFHFMRGFESQIKISLSWCVYKNRQISTEVCRFFILPNLSGKKPHPPISRSRSLPYRNKSRLHRVVQPALSLG